MCILKKNLSFAPPASVQKASAPLLHNWRSNAVVVVVVFVWAVALPLPFDLAHGAGKAPSEDGIFVSFGEESLESVEIDTVTPHEVGGLLGERGADVADVGRHEGKDSLVADRVFRELVDAERRDEIGPLLLTKNFDFLGDGSKGL